MVKIFTCCGLEMGKIKFRAKFWLEISRSFLVLTSKFGPGAWDIQMESKTQMESEMFSLSVFIFSLFTKNTENVFTFRISVFTFRVFMKIWVLLYNSVYKRQNPLFTFRVYLSTFRHKHGKCFHFSHNCFHFSPNAFEIPYSMEFTLSVPSSWFPSMHWAFHAMSTTDIDEKTMPTSAN